MNAEECCSTCACYNAASDDNGKHKPIISPDAITSFALSKRRRVIAYDHTLHCNGPLVVVKVA
jgi:hypothetical protein